MPQFLNVLLVEAQEVGVPQPQVLIEQADQRSLARASAYNDETARHIWNEDFSFEVKPTGGHRVIFWIYDGPKSNRVIASVSANFRNLKQNSPPRDWWLPLEREFQNFQGSLHFYLSLSSTPHRISDILRSTGVSLPQVPAPKAAKLGPEGSPLSPALPVDLMGARNPSLWRTPLDDSGELAPPAPPPRPLPAVGEAAGAPSLMGCGTLWSCLTCDANSAPAVARSRPPSDRGGGGGGAPAASGASKWLSDAVRM